MSVANENRWVEEVGAPAFESIRDMTAALHTDYDRLEELRELRDECGGSINELEYPGYSEELTELEDVAGGCTSQDEARDRILEDALSVRIFGERVDGEWTADRFELLLTTGGPAVRIMGELDSCLEPSRAWLEVQDWGKPWTQYLRAGNGEILLDYCRCFCFE